LLARDPRATITLMKFVLQSSVHNLYVIGTEDWTEDIEAARTFTSAREASAFADAHGLQKVRLISRLRNLFAEWQSEPLAAT
jgi:hypothetical protein